MPIKITEFEDSFLPSLKDMQKANVRPDVNKAKSISKNCIALLGSNALGILLYGSAARNDADENSDLDLLILIDKLSASTKELLIENISDEGCLVSIQIMSLKGILGSFLIRDPYLLGPLREGIVLYDKIKILSSFIELVESTEAMPTQFTSSFLKARSDKRISIADFKINEALHHIIASATDCGFSIAHSLGKAPRTVNEMIEILQYEPTSSTIADAIKEIFVERYSDYSILLEKVTLIKQLVDEYYEKAIFD